MTQQRRWFVTGTDTGIGKTLVSSAMLSLLAGSGLRAVGMKPVAAGLEEVDGAWRNEDVEQLHAAGNVDAPLELRCPYLLRAPMSPHLAARQDGVSITLQPLLSAFEELSARADAPGLFPPGLTWSVHRGPRGQSFPGGVRHNT